MMLYDSNLNGIISQIMTNINTTTSIVKVIFGNEGLNIRKHRDAK
jgi:hypothetical protein